MMKRSDLPEFDRSVVIALGDATAGRLSSSPLMWLDARELSRKSGLRVLTADLQRLEVYELAHFRPWQRGKRVMIRWRLTQKGAQWRLFYKRRRRMEERSSNA